MNHRIIQLDPVATVLLDRMENDASQDEPWQVIMSTYVGDDYRYDEWVNFSNVNLAQSWIDDFPLRMAINFRLRAKAAHQDRAREREFKAKLDAAFSSPKPTLKDYWRTFLAFVRRAP